MRHGVLFCLPRADVACCSCSWTPGTAWRLSGEYNPARDRGRAAPHAAAERAAPRPRRASARRAARAAAARRRARALRARAPRSRTGRPRASRTPGADCTSRRAAPSRSRRTQRCRTSAVSRSRASRPNGAAVSKPRPISGASMPSRRTRPTVDTSIVSPSMTVVHEHRVGPCDLRARRGCLNSGNSRHGEQRCRICIRVSIWRGIARIADALCNRPPTARSRPTRAARLGAVPGTCQSHGVGHFDRVRVSDTCRSADELVAEAVDGEDELGGLRVVRSSDAARRRGRRRCASAASRRSPTPPTAARRATASRRDAR